MFMVVLEWSREGVAADGFNDVVAVAAAAAAVAVVAAAAAAAASFFAIAVRGFCVVIGDGG